MARKKKRPSLYDLSLQPITEEHHAALRREMLEGTDRSSALLGAALVDTTLRHAIRSRFVAMDEAGYRTLFLEPTAPLSSFAARIKLGRAIGIYGPHYNGMLDTIRRVRNAFAHSVIPLEFSHEAISDECRNLPEALVDKPGLDHNLSLYRERYIGVCARLGIIFEDYAKRHVGHPVPIELE